MTRIAILAATASLLVLGWAGSSQAQDDARAAGDTSLSAQSIQGPPPGPMPAPTAPPTSDAPPPAPPPSMAVVPMSAGGPRVVCPPAHPPRDYPRDAHPGQCFARVRTAPTYESYTEQVLVAPARTESRTIPASYEWAERQVLVEPARVERHLIPATYRDVVETIVVAPATVRIDRIDPVYDLVADQVMTRPAHTEWRRTFVGADGLTPADDRVEPTGEVLCLIEIPAEYATVQRRVLREPGHTIETPIPAVTREVTRQVIDQPASYVETQIPAVYRTERYQRLVTPARVETREIAPVYASRVRQRMVSPGHLEWRPVACDPNRPKPETDGERG